MGCGSGIFHRHARDLCESYVGADVIRHEGFPGGVAFRPVDLDAGRVDLPGQSADVVVCVETIEHLENPRALFLELARLTRPGGLVVVTTPNQVSWLRNGTQITSRFAQNLISRPWIGAKPRRNPTWTPMPQESNG